MQQYISGSVADAVTIACKDTPNSITLSSSLDDINETKKSLNEAGPFARELKTGKTYHSPHMYVSSTLCGKILTVNTGMRLHLCTESFTQMQPSCS